MAQDRGHQLTDKMLTDLEKRLRNEYEQAAREIQNQLDDYLRRYKTKDKIWQKWVEKGVKTQEEYDQWRIGQMAVGERWEKMKDRIVADEMNANRIAREITNQEMPSIFSLNANYALYQVEHDAKIDTGMTLYNREAVDRILREDPDLLLPPGKKVSQQIKTKKAVRWEKQKIQSVMMQGIIQGESIPTIAARLSEEVATMDFNAAIRNARTMTTNAQNAGRYDAYERLTNNGVELTLEWAATLDNRTRHEHRMMHGQRRDVGEPFVVDGIEIMYPAQTGSFMGISNVPQEMIWNCRCTILAFVKGFEHDTIKTSDKMGNMTFEEWLNAKPESQDIQHQYELGKEFEQSYIRQYGGGWGDEKGTSGPDGGGPGPVTGTDITETWERRSDEFKFEIDDVLDAQGFDGKPRFLSQEEFEEAVKAANGGEGFIAQRTYSAPDIETLRAYQEQLYNGNWYVDCSVGTAAYGQGMYATGDFSGKTTDNMNAATEFYENLNKQKGNPFSMVETFTLTPDAKVADYDKLYDDFRKYGMETQEKNAAIRTQAIKDANRELADRLLKDAGFESEEAKKFFYGNLSLSNVGWQEMGDAYQKLGQEGVNKMAKMQSEFYKRQTDFVDEYVKNKSIDEIKDIGSYAASRGYDAISVNKRGVNDTTEVVILNRTKMIILRDD